MHTHVHVPDITTALVTLFLAFVDVKAGSGVWREDEARRAVADQSQPRVAANLRAVVRRR